ncbi:MAG: hypothetical protein OEW16_08295, partial [Gammaproteobacteria bacterium]|nr:hypothetical protein [Gammaproteobacteria bacterium]
DGDTQEINAYVLTDAGLARYTNAIAALGSIAKQQSGDCDEDSDEDSDEDNGKSIDQLEAKINAVPGAKAAFQSAGMTAREYIVFSMSIFQAGMASWAMNQAGAKLPAGVSMTNVEFYRKNEAALTRLGEATQSDDCGDRETEDDGSE